MGVFSPRNLSFDSTYKGGYYMPILNDRETDVKAEKPKSKFQIFFDKFIGVFLSLVFIACGIIAIAIAATILVKGTIATWEIIKHIFT